MKKVLSFIISSIVVGLVFVVCTFYLIVGQTKDVFSDSYMATLRTKYDVLKNTNEPKIIIVAGSSGAFAFDNDLLEKETGYKVANTALHAGEGYLFETSLSKANINKGDIVLLGLEWGWESPNAFDSFGTDLIMSGIDSQLEMYKYVPATKYKDVLGYLFTYANKKKTYAGSEGVYSRSSFDENGNMTLYKNSKVVGKWNSIQTVTDVKDAVISEESIKYLQDYKEYVESCGASVYWIAVPIWDETVQCEYDDFRKLAEQEEEKIGIKWISDPVDYIFPAKYMFDGTGMYHMSTEGTIHRTEQVVADLKNAGIIDNTERVIIEPGHTYDFSYTGDFQSFTALEDGKYRIEAWGASGKENDSIYKKSAGRGSYTAGTIELKKEDVLYAYVGGQDGYNGGGIGEATGGDATDIRLASGAAQEFSGLKTRIMVAAGGGGGMYNTTQKLTSAGDGGSLEGSDALCVDSKGNTDGGGHGGMQTAGGEYGNQNLLIPNAQSVSAGFGYGGYNINFSAGCSKIASGGGGGYYGGGAGIHPGGSWDGGGGGSSYVSGYEGCDAISEDSTVNNIHHTGQPIHYSGMVFSDIEMIAGTDLMPSATEDSNVYGWVGTGHVRITYLGK